MPRTARHAATALVLATLVAASPGLRAQEIKVTLLGTGGPAPGLQRFGPSTLVEAGGEAYVFDAGRGALQRLAQASVRWQAVDGVFLTHLHSDHVVGLPDLWLTGWLVGPGRDRPLAVRGPPGTRAMLAHLRRAFAFDIAVRISDDRAAPDGVAIMAEDLAGGAVVHSKAGVRITAFVVDHAPVEPALGYRIDYRGRSVVLSGDTRVSRNLIAHARGADLLVCEVVSPDALLRAGVGARRARSVAAHHMTAEQAGEVFAAAKPRLAVYSHVVPPDAAPADLLARTRTAYAGPLQVGEDRMVIVVGATVEIRRPPPPAP